MRQFAHHWAKTRLAAIVLDSSRAGVWLVLGDCFMHWAFRFGVHLEKATVMLLKSWWSCYHRPFSAIFKIVVFVFPPSFG